MSQPTTLNTSQCFDDIISIRGYCEEVVPTSGFYLDQAGITLEECGQYIGSEYEASQDLFTDKRDFSINLIASQILSYLTPRLKTNTLIDEKRVGFFNENLELIQPNASYQSKGINFLIESNNSFLDFFISEISLQINYTGQVVVYLADLQQDSIIETFLITTEDKIVSTIYPQYSVHVNRRNKNLYLFYETTGKPSYYTTINKSGCTNCRPFNRCSMVTATPYMMNSGVPKIKSALQSVNDTGGMSVVYSVNCNHKNFLCSISNLIALPLVYKTCAEIMDYAINTPNDRLNTAKLVDRDLLEKRKVEYEFKFREALDSALRNINPTDETCFNCNNQISNRIVLP